MLSIDMYARTYLAVTVYVCMYVCMYVCILERRSRIDLELASYVCT